MANHKEETNVSQFKNSTPEHTTPSNITPNSPLPGYQNERRFEPPVTSTTEPNSSQQERLNRVRRRLDFGYDDHIDDNDKSLGLPLEISISERERSRMKWNFDFENELPLEGDWVWERIPADCPSATDVVSSMEIVDGNRRI